MQELDDIALLRQFAAQRSEAAFDQLVSRHAGFVHSAALRQVRDPQWAAEITQAVFLILAQKAARISDKTILTGWLFKTTRFVALAQVRAEAKRRQHDQETQMHTRLQTEPSSDAGDRAWAELAPLLDQALAQLGETDRQAVLLRYFENKSLAEVGNKLGAGEDTARKRVSRALEKLRKFFAKNHVVYSTAIIAGAISANAVQAAPAGVVAAIPAMAVKGSAIAVSTLTLVKEALKLMTIAKLKAAALVAAAAILTAGSTVVVNQVIAQSGGDASAIDDSAWDNISSRALQALPPGFILRPTHFATPFAPGAAFSAGKGYGGGMVVSGNKMLGRAITFDSLMAAAFDVDFNRVVSPPGAPAGAFDLLMTAPDASK
ncbi:MAG: sigma-70 family RNA polymerase sigma factor, partial [Verrucomicrobiota bacterium]